MFELHDVKEAMQKAEVHLASAPAKAGGRVRLTWKPAANSFRVVHAKDGAIVSATYSNGPNALESLYAEFVSRAKP